MPAERVMDAIRTLARAPDPRGDGELVSRFVAARDEDAFAELLRRHGPTVFGVCRRVLGQAHDAEDAFQAVWVVFARRAGDVHPPGSVGHFLYGVAVRTATKARIMAAKRRLREVANADQPRPEPKQTDPELAAILDDELAKLPDKYRAAVVLCDVNGKSRSTAAAELGWPEGTVADRVRKGRELLATRLRARGVTLSAAGLAAALTQTATAAPARLAANVLATTFGGGAVPSSALLLAESVMRTMSAARWKLPLALLATCGLVAGVGLAGRPGAAEPEKPVAKGAHVSANEEEAPAPVPPGQSWKEVATLSQTGWLPGSVAYSPDGKLLVVGGTSGHVRAYDAVTQKQLWDAKLEGNFSGTAFSHDSKTLAATFKDGVKFLDAATGKEGEAIVEKDSNPTVVATFPDEPVEGDAQLKRRKIAFDGPRGTHIKYWVKWTQIEGYGAAAIADPLNERRRPLGEVALAADPRGEWVLVTGQIRDRSEKYELHGVRVIRKPGPDGFDQRPGFAMGREQAVTTTCAAWSADGSTIVAGDEHGDVIVWDVATRKEKGRVGFDRRVAAVAVTKDGSHVAAAVVANEQNRDAGEPAYWERVHVWPTKDAPKQPEALKAANDKALGGPFQGMAGLAFAPDGKSLAVGYANFTHLTRTGRLIGTVRVWKLAGDEKPDAPKSPEQVRKERQR